MPNKSGMISEEATLRLPPTIGIEGVRRHIGEFVIVERDGRRYSGRLQADEDGPYLTSLSTRRTIIRVQAHSDELCIFTTVSNPVEGRNGIYMKRYQYF